MDLFEVVARCSVSGKVLQRNATKMLHVFLLGPTSLNSSQITVQECLSKEAARHPRAFQAGSLACRSFMSAGSLSPACAPISDLPALLIYRPSRKLVASRGWKIGGRRDSRELNVAA
jgi:hypothetical protein